MKGNTKWYLFLPVALVLLISMFMSGCIGIPEEEYNKVKAELAQAETQIETQQAKITELETKITTLEEQNTSPYASDEVIAMSKQRWEEALSQENITVLGGAINWKALYIGNGKWKVNATVVSKRKNIPLLVFAFNKYDKDDWTGVMDYHLWVSEEPDAPRGWLCFWNFYEKSATLEYSFGGLN